MSNPQHDPVNHPAYYTSHPAGIECLDVIEEMNHVNLAMAVKYVWRADATVPKDNPLEDLEKARFYIQREIDRRKKRAPSEDRGEPANPIPMQGTRLPGGTRHYDTEINGMRVTALYDGEELVYARGRIDDDFRVGELITASGIVLDKQVRDWHLYA